MPHHARPDTGDESGDLRAGQRRQLSGKDRCLSAARKERAVANAAQTAAGITRGNLPSRTAANGVYIVKQDSTAAVGQSSGQSSLIRRRALHVQPQELIPKRIALALNRCRNPSAAQKML